MRILVVDDDPVGAALAADLLVRWGYAVEAAATGEAGWQALQQRPPDLLLLDWGLPDIEGPELCRRLRAAPALAGIYVVMLSAHDRKEDVVRGLEAGANDYLTKPFVPAELKARIGMAAQLVIAHAALAARVRELEEALAHVRRLQEIIPICAYCRRVRDDRNFWQKVETYVTERSGSRFSHGICPECLEKQMREAAE